jgi:hypothetical protein
MIHPKFPVKLLAIDTNAKTVKGQKYGFMTGILYLAPSTISGHNTCPMATIAKCEKACLYSAGRGAFSSVQNSRINKAQLFFSHRDRFMTLLVKDIERLIRKAEREGMTPLVRLNGTSDIRWESIRFNHTFAHGKTRNVTIFEIFPEVQFYDYTKLANRKDIPANYDLTFSYSGVAAYQKYVSQAIASGMRLAAVFRSRQDIPESFIGLDCVDGDDSDIRHMDPKGVVVALYAKGAAKQDRTGFVVDPGPGLAANRIIPISLAA